MDLPIKKAVICPTIVGRVSELAALQSMVSELDARSRGFQVLQGNCYGRDRTSPYAPVLDLMRSFIATQPRNEREAHFQPFAQEFPPCSPTWWLLRPAR